MKSNVENRNTYYEGLIQNLYCGNSGCFQSFMRFFYQLNQSLVFDQKNVKVFQQLCDTEIENCKMLCSALLDIGGDNKYYSSSKKFLSGYSVDYTKNFSQMFVSDIEMLEVQMIETKNCIYKVENEKIKSVIKKLLENKKKSLKILRENYFKNNIIKN